MSSPNKDCPEVPSMFSAFVDTFVDYTVGGQFLGLKPTESNNAKRGSKSRDKQAVRTSYPAPNRLIAIGDIHGDLNKAKEALLIAEVMDHKERWIGGETVVVQVGDLLDRGGEEIKVIYLLEKLKREARRAGGDVHIMNGNHELMNAEGDFKYVTPEGVDEFQRWATWYQMGKALKERCTGLEKPYDFFQNLPDDKLMKVWNGRIAALRPGGPITSRFLAPHPMVLIVGGNLFVHGGILPKHIDYGLDKINRRSKKWMEGRGKSRAPKCLRGSQSLVWVRNFSVEKASTCNCKDLEATLRKVPGAKRMVMGHTIQRFHGINGVCDNKAVRVDVGMSRGCIDAAPEVLEILNDNVMTVLSASSSKQDKSTFLVGSSGGLADLLNPNSPALKVPVNLQTSQNLLSFLGDSFVLSLWVSFINLLIFFFVTSLPAVERYLTQFIARLCTISCTNDPCLEWAIHKAFLHSRKCIAVIASRLPVSVA